MNFEQSENIESLAAALSEYLSEVVDPKADRSNAHFGNEYTTISSVLEAVRKPLAGHGLSVVQSVGGTASEPNVTTQLMHKSGQWIRGTCQMAPTKPTPQGVGSTYTYMRRYALKAMLSLGDHDDDGNAGSAKGNGEKKEEPKGGVSGLTEDLEKKNGNGQGGFWTDVHTYIQDYLQREKKDKPKVQMALLHGFLEQAGFDSKPKQVGDLGDAEAQAVYKIIAEKAGA